MKHHEGNGVVPGERCLAWMPVAKTLCAKVEGHAGGHMSIEALDHHRDWWESKRTYGECLVCGAEMLLQKRSNPLFLMCQECRKLPDAWCAECGKPFKKYRKEIVTCGLSCAARMRARKSGTVGGKKVKNVTARRTETETVGQTAKGSVA